MPIPGIAEIETAIKARLQEIEQETKRLQRALNELNGKPNVGRPPKTA